MANTCIIQPNSLTAVINGVVHTIGNSHPSFAQVRDALRASDWETAERLIDVPTAISEYSEGNIVVEDGVVYYKDEVIHHVVCDRILEFLEQDVDFQPLVSFLGRLLENPSRNSVDQLYDFLENKNIPIDGDGMILAYKAVRGDYRDIFSGKFNNTPGSEIEMPRRDVDNNPANHCSAGFHVGALGYVRDFGRNDGKIVICCVDPADVVSVPEDHNCQKMRVCKYKVLEDYTGPLPSTVYQPADELNNNEGW